MSFRISQVRVPHTRIKYWTKEIIDRIPELYAQDGKGDKAIVHVKFFTPDSSWIWYITEASAIIAGEYFPLDQVGQLPVDDIKMFGLADGHFKELGYEMFSKILESRGPWGLPIERDIHFPPTRLGDVR